MASRLHESINSLGVLLSLAVSFFGFYYEHVRTSEAVDASVSILNPKSDSNSKLESAIIDLILLNKGKDPITVSDLWFDVTSEDSTCCGRSPALKINEDTLISPILLPSMQASKVTVRFKLSGWPRAPWGGRIVSKDDPPREPSPPPLLINVEKKFITIELVTIGPDYGRQVTKMPVGTLDIKDWAWTGYSPAITSSDLTPIRKDPPFFKSIWRSITN
jgi:hypothetical protein